MATILEFNDWQLRLLDHNANQQRCEVAAASFDKRNSKQLQFGDMSLKQARVDPQQFSNRYLMAMNAEPLRTSFGQAKNLADLVYHHLNSISHELGDEQTIFAVPGYFSNEQLGLLLGIAQHANINTLGFVDSALLYTHATPSLPEEFEFIDLELHRICATPMVCEDNVLKVLSSRPIEGFGIYSAIDGWMNLAADEFIQHTRFDPLHTGACEQQLQDQVVDWITQGQVQTKITVEHSGNLREVEISQSVLTSKLSQRFENLHLEGKNIVVSPRIQAVPGMADVLREQFAQHGQNVIYATPPNKRFLDDILELSNPAEIVRIQEIPCLQHAGLNQRDTAPTVETSQVTHLLNNHRARPISEFDNVPSNIKPGDRIELDEPYTAIVVETAGKA